MKTKNVPYGIKCKVNPNFQLRRSQKGWVSGGFAIWEKFPNNTVFLELTPKREIAGNMSQPFLIPGMGDVHFFRDWSFQNLPLLIED